MANIALHDEMITNPAEVLTEDYWGFETFVGLRDDNIIDVLHEVHLIEDLKE